MKDLEWIFVSKIGMIKIDIFLNLKLIECAMSKNFLGFNLVYSSDLVRVNELIFSQEQKTMLWNVLFKGLPPTVHQKKQNTNLWYLRIEQNRPDMDVLIMDTACFIPYF